MASSVGQTLIAVTPEELEDLIERGVRKALEKRPEGKRFMEAEELAEHYGVSKGTVKNWVRRDGCPHILRGRVLRFELAAVDAWMRGREPGLRRVK